MSTPQESNTVLTVSEENDKKCARSFWNLNGFFLDKACKDYNRRKAGNGVATGSTAITPVERKDLGSVPAVADEKKTPPSGQQAASGQPAAQTRGGWFSRGGKRKSKAKKSKRKNRKQKKSRKSRK
jgi:hypothetical protein